MYPQPPPGQGPLDPRGAFSPPPAPNAAQGHPAAAPGAGPMPPPMMPPAGYPPMPPPPNFMPPMYMMPPPPPRRRGGFFRGLLIFCVITVLGISITLNIFLLAGTAFSGNSSLRETDVVRGDPTQKIAVIPLVGLIDDEAYVKFDKFLRTAEEDKNIKGIVLHVDSPGGTVSASDQIYHRIQRFKSDRPGVPVVVAQAGLAASGGYYVSCAADYIYAQPTTLTGNIGVIMPRFNVSKLFEKWGIEETTITSKGATYKNAGSMFKPADPQAEAYIQDLADQVFVQFKEVVLNGRKPKLTMQEVEVLANGKIYTAQDAKNAKLIDEIGYTEDACQYVATKLGLTKQTIVRYQNPPTLFDLLSSKSNVPARGATSNTNITINGVQVDAKGLTDLMIPRPMYLWRGE
jgi:protease-4